MDGSTPKIKRKLPTQNHLNKFYKHKKTPTVSGIPEAVAAFIL